MRKFIRVGRVLLHGLVYAFALVGFVWTGGFLAIRWGWTNVSGAPDAQTAVYNEVAAKTRQYENVGTPSASPAVPQLATADPMEQAQWCSVAVIGQQSPATAGDIVRAYELTESLPLLINMVQAASFRLLPEGVASMNDCKAGTSVDQAALRSQYRAVTGDSLYPWMNDAQWGTIEQAIVKDQAVIERAAKDANVSPRMIVAVCIVEQLRLYYTQRELYEKVFAPLKVLSTANKMAWGTMAIKEDTAIKTEEHLRDPHSEYYLGSMYEHLLDMPAEQATDMRYQRLTNQRDHYYSYLYGGLYLAEVTKQWEQEGFSIGSRPEILATLFNIGFNNSKPKAEPQVGGSQIEINGVKYSFGSLAYEFYYSGRLTEAFPYTW